MKLYRIVAPKIETDEDDEDDEQNETRELKVNEKTATALNILTFILALQSKST